MSIQRIYPEKDTTIYNTLSPAGLSANTGADEILEIYSRPTLDGLGETSRILIQFATVDINAAVAKTGTGSYVANLHLNLATAEELPSSFTIEAHNITGSWEGGIGRSFDNPVNISGASWKYRGAQETLPWNTEGGDMGVYSNSKYYENTPLYQSRPDLNIDVTEITQKIQSGSIENSGILLKLENSLEFSTGSNLSLKYFSKETHTIYAPYLEIKHKDVSYVTGSIAEIPTEDFTVHTKNNKGTYPDTGTIQMNLAVRKKFPERTYSTSSLFLAEYRLPELSCYGVKDVFSNEMIIDFDPEYTAISAGSNGSYFNLNLDSLYPERYYRIYIQTVINGSNLIYQIGEPFKVV